MARASFLPKQFSTSLRFSVPKKQRPSLLWPPGGLTAEKSRGLFEFFIGPGVHAFFWGCREETAPCFFTAWKNPGLYLSAKYLCRKPKPRAPVAAFCQKSAVQPCKYAFGFAKAHTMKPSPFRICRKKKAPWGARRCHPDKRGGAWVSFDCGRTVQEGNIKQPLEGAARRIFFWRKQT